MPGWTLVDTRPTQGRTFQRPLDPLELCFLWDGLFDGTEDSLHHYEVSLSNSSQDARLFSEANIVKAWVSTKRRFPLAGATVRGADGAPLRFEVAPWSNANIGAGFASEPHFVVREHDLAVLRPREVVFVSVASAEEAQRQAAAIIHGPRPLSEELLVQLYVLRETDPERTEVLHLMVLTAHCVTDGTANRALVRCLLDTLARGGGPEPVQAPLEERLAMTIPPMDLEPAHARVLGTGIRRWRRAVGIVIHQLRMAKTQVCFVFVFLRRIQSGSYLDGNVTGRAYSSVSAHALDDVRSSTFWRGLYFAYPCPNPYRDCQLSSAWHHFRKCLPRPRASGDDSRALPTVPPR